jgi:glycosyltransferase involved in cell wall biosynthesis
MHILYLHQYYCPHGGRGNDRSASFSRHWVQAGCSVTVLTSTAYFPEGHPAHTKPVYRFEDAGVQVVALNVPYRQEMPLAHKALAFVRFAWRLWQHALGLPKPDVIYASTTPPTVGEVGRRLARRWQVPWLLEVVDVWPDVPVGMGIITNPILRDFFQLSVDRLYHEANAIVALSEGMAEQVASHCRQQTPIHVIHNGTDTASFVPAELTAEPYPIQLLYAGAMGAANGVGQLLHVARHLEAHSDLPPFELHLVGWGAQRAHLQQQAIQMGLRCLRFLPPVPKADMPALMRQYAVGLVSFAPYKVLEANSANKFYDYLAAGLPVVLNYEGWQARYLREWGCGFAYPQGDAAGVAGGLAKLLASPNMRRAMGAQARRLAEACFDRGVLASRALALIEGTQSHG